MLSRRLLTLSLTALVLFTAASAAAPVASAEWPGYDLCSTAQPEWRYHCDGLACIQVYAYAWNIDETVCTPA